MGAPVSDGRLDCTERSRKFLRGVRWLAPCPAAEPGAVWFHHDAIAGHLLCAWRHGRLWPELDGQVLVLPWKSLPSEGHSHVGGLGP